MATVAACSGDDTTAPTQDASAIVGIEWQLTELVLDGDAVDLTGIEAKLRFDGDGSWSADACNSYGGPVSIAAGSLTAGPGESTLVGCHGTDHVVDTGVQALMSGEVTWSIEADELHLDGDGVEATYVEDTTPFPTELDVVLLSGADFQVGYADSGGTPVLTWEGREAPGQGFAISAFAIDDAFPQAYLVRQRGELLAFASLPAGTTSARYGDVELPVTELPGGLLATAAFVDVDGAAIVALDAAGAELWRSPPLTAP